MHRTASLMACVVALCVAFAIAQDQTEQRDTQGRDGDRARGGQVDPNQQGTFDKDRQTESGAQAQIAGDRTRSTLERPGTPQMDQEFIKHAASANQFEIQLSQHVADRGEDSQVKRFAQRMVEDHRQAAENLKQTAQRMNVDINDNLMPVHQAKLQHFQQKQGHELDLAYIFTEVAHHHKDVLEYQYMSRNAQSPELKQFTAQVLPKLRDHLQMAEQIAPGGTEARTAGARIDDGAHGSDHDRKDHGTGGDRDR